MKETTLRGPATRLALVLVPLAALSLSHGHGPVAAESQQAVQGSPPTAPQGGSAGAKATFERQIQLLYTINNLGYTDVCG